MFVVLLVCSLAYGFSCGLFDALLGLLRFCSAVVRRARVLFSLVLSIKAFVVALRPAAASVLAPCESSQLPRKKRSSESFTRASSGPNRCSIARWRALVFIAPVARVNRLLVCSKRAGTASRHVFCELSTLTGRPPVAQAAPACASWEVDLVLAVDVVPRKTH